MAMVTIAAGWKLTFAECRRLAVQPYCIDHSSDAGCGELPLPAACPLRVARVGDNACRCIAAGAQEDERRCESSGQLAREYSSLRGRPGSAGCARSWQPKRGTSLHADAQLGQHTGRGHSICSCLFEHANLHARPPGLADWTLANSPRHALVPEPGAHSARRAVGARVHLGSARISHGRLRQKSLRLGFG